MRYALIREMDISNGAGIGVSLFVQGCHFQCKGCFNPETWDFDGGKEWTPKVAEKFKQLAGKSYVQRITILGGEPLADENVQDVYNLICELKQQYPDKKIWMYTGYTWEQIMASNNVRKWAVLSVDVLAEGLFRLDLQDINNKQIKWVGSLNQRVIDVKQSVSTNQIVLFQD